MAFNDPDSEQKIDIVKSSIDNVADGTTLAPLSVTLFKIAIEE